MSWVCVLYRQVSLLQDHPRHFLLLLAHSASSPSHRCALPTSLPMSDFEICADAFFLAVEFLRSLQHNHPRSLVSGRSLHFRHDWNCQWVIPFNLCLQPPTSQPSTSQRTETCLVEKAAISQDSHCLGHVQTHMHQ